MGLRRIITTTAVCAVVLVAGLTAADAARTAGSDPLPTLGHAPQLTRTAGTPSNDSCGYAAAVPADRFKGIPTSKAAHASGPYTASLLTTQGRITFRALTTQAPCTTYSFRFLATRHYFNGTHCHRLTLQGIYVLQCGDPTGTGSGGPGYAFDDENLSGATYPAGTVAMANAGPNTNGSQFFMVYKNTKLSPAYTPFGVITHGMSVLKRIAAAGDDSQNGPGDGYPHAFVRFAWVGIHPTK